MSYNLIDEPWIRVRRQSGLVESIAPWRIAETTDPPIAVETSRPDFDAALLEFLIGLVQTVWTPKTEGEWQDIYEDGVEPAVLKERMQTVRQAFFLDGDGSRFMQDLDVHLDAKKKEEPIAGLLIDQGMAKDTALFAKSGRFESLSYPAAASALMTMQAFAPSGGAGNYTSLRGGGPLSVAIVDETLWKTVWCNVLNRASFKQVPGDPSLTDDARCFPWMGSTRNDGGKDTLPEQVHPLQHYWGLPRRVRLRFDDERFGRCAVFGDENVPVVDAWFGRPKGMRYQGPFLHPLTPYTKGKKDEEAPNPKKGRSGVAYRDWPTLVIGGENAIPPRNVLSFLETERGQMARAHRIAVRGYDMDNMKPVSFIDVEAPLFHIEKTALPSLQREAGLLVEASESVRLTLNRQVKAGWSDRPKDLRGDVNARVDTMFWSRTETAFYAAIERIHDALVKSDEPAREESKRAFLEALHRAALGVFDELCPLEVDLGAGDLGRLVNARRFLDRLTNTKNANLLGAIGLAVPEESKKNAKKPANEKAGKEAAS